MLDGETDLGVLDAYWQGSYRIYHACMCIQAADDGWAEGTISTLQKSSLHETEVLNSMTLRPSASGPEFVLHATTLTC